MVMSKKTRGLVALVEHVASAHTMSPKNPGQKTFAHDGQIRKHGAELRVGMPAAPAHGRHATWIPDNTSHKHGLRCSTRHCVAHCGCDLRCGSAAGQKLKPTEKKKHPNKHDPPTPAVACECTARAQPRPATLFWTMIRVRGNWRRPRTRRGCGVMHGTAAAGPRGCSHFALDAQNGDHNQKIQTTTRSA